MKSRITKTARPRWQWLRVVAMTMVLGGVVVGCAEAPAKSVSSARQEKAQINTDAQKVLQGLYERTPEAKILVAKAKGVLIFPKVFAVGVMVGGEYGRGVLRVSGVPQDYYSVLAATVGLKAGVQSKAQVLLFMTDDAIRTFRDSQGWEVGADASVAMMKTGASGHLDVRNIHQPVLGFVMNNAGLMAGASLDGQKISKLDI
ncbi:twin-arginine translocation pathway signal [Chromobacterium sp. Panama]|uniref:BPSL1445 family SYLF domain-containing lipoprotein n=1 Tax=Chromobacterium sp. Panama TaxID=2161826 RepID=UPI000D3243A9|nr:YSC84-related protein [Chromobacterium sp. Panama]PTU66949.1 twin-arginine translocation pathway signal [Chromobacterium sp. Panama]